TGSDGRGRASCASRHSLALSLSTPAHRTGTWPTRAITEVRIYRFWNQATVVGDTASIGTQVWCTEPSLPTTVSHNALSALVLPGNWMSAYRSQRSPTRPMPAARNERGLFTFR